MGSLEVIGYVAAVFMGAVFGVIGSGASVLTMPILVYLMGFTPVIATAYSLVLVGGSAALGSIHYYRQGLIDISSVLFFGIPSILTAYLTRAWLLPILPNPILTSPIYISKNFLIMALFCILLGVAGGMLLWNGRVQAPKKNGCHSMGWIFLEGAVIGCVTALVGAGGGFLIIPALVLFLGIVAYLLVSQFKTILGAAFTAYNIYGTALTPSLLAAFLWKRATRQGAIASILTGTLISITWTFFLPSWDGYQYLNPFLKELTYPASILSILALIVVSMATPKPNKENLEPFFRS